MRNHSLIAFWLMLAISLTAQDATSSPRQFSQPRPSVRIAKIEPRPLVLRKSTSLRLTMPYPVSISASPVGQRLTWEAAEDVGVDGAVFIAKGAKAGARVTTIFATGTRRRLSMTIDSVQLTNGETAQLFTEPAGNRIWNFFTTRTDDAVIPEGTEITVFLASDVSIRPVQQPANDTAQALSAPKALPILLTGSTAIYLKFAHPVTSEYAQAGDRVSFLVAEPVIIDSLTVVAKGAIAWGTVTDVQTSRNFGRPGKLSITLDYVQLANRKKAPLRAISDAQGKASPADRWGPGLLHVAGGTVRAAMENSYDVTIPEGTELTAYIKNDVTLDPADLRAE